MITLLFKSIQLHVRNKFFKKAEVGFREAVVIGISLFLIALFMYLVIKRFYVFRTK